MTLCKRYNLMRKFFAISMILACMAAARGDVGNLTYAQKKKLLTEAQTQYDAAAAIEASDPDKARADYASAAQKFQVVASASQPSGWLYYDLANAYLKSGNLGLAIANYKRAEQYIGGDSRLASNLDYARGTCVSQLQPPRTQGWNAALTSLNARVSATVRAWIGIGGWCLLWVGVVGSMFIKRMKWRMVIISGATVCVLMAASLGWEYESLASDYQGVVTAQDTIIRKGNGVGYAPMFKEPLCEGAEFRVLDERRGWLEIQLGDGKSGWIPASDAELIPPRKMF